MQSRKSSSLEAAMNTVVGILLNQVVLALFGVPLSKATAITAIMIAISFVRSYAIRRVFARKEKLWDSN